MRPTSRRYASLFNSYVGLLSALEDSRNLLLIGSGASGIAPLRAALDWAPVQARSCRRIAWGACGADEQGVVRRMCVVRECSDHQSMVVLTGRV